MFNMLFVPYMSGKKKDNKKQGKQNFVAKEISIQ
jgi:hypothetical protein